MAKQIRASVLVRAAKVRALVISHLNASDVMLSTKQIYDQLSEELSGMRIDISALRTQLSQLATNNLITTSIDGSHRFYGSEHIQPNKDNKKPKVEVTIKSKNKKELPLYKIDVIKNSQRLRIQLADAIFEVGVVLN